jgi:hypothetical protein
MTHTHTGSLTALCCRCDVAGSGAAAPPARRRPGKEPYDDVEPDAASAPRSKRAPLLLRRLERFLPPPLRFILHVRCDSPPIAWFVCRGTILATC